MAIIKCKMCGGDLNIIEGVSTAECEYCGTKQTVPNADNEKKMTLFARANRLRAKCEFDKAYSIYESIVAEFPEEAEAYWGLVICTFGIEYVDDPATAQKIPTCHRASFDSVASDENYQLALEHADVMAQKVYRDEAREIDRIREDILSVSKTEKPYDIFICYKETAEDGGRTIDSVIAQDTYDALTAKGYRVFFARISLEDKLGQQYEPYIFAALNSAKVMLVFGTKYEYFHAVWVKNEWSRFMALVARDKSKVLIPCYKDMDAYDMPDEFKALQAQDMGKVGALQDLLRGIEKIIPKQQAATVIKEQVVIEQGRGGAAIDPLLKRLFMFLEEGNWKSADEYCEKVLDIDPENAQAYLGKLLAELKVRTKEALKNIKGSFITNSNYLKVIRFGDESLKQELEGYAEAIEKQLEAERIERSYDHACALMSHKKQDMYLKAAKLFESFGDYKDSVNRKEECIEKAEVLRKDAILAEGKAYMSKPTETIAYYEDAIKAFKEIPGWKDADEQVVICHQKIDELNAKAEADRLERERQAKIAYQEAERRRKKNKKIAIITSSAVSCCIVLAALWIFVLSPIISYNRAQSLFDKGSYDSAIAIYTKLGDYKDSSDKIFETKYAKAESLFASKHYDESVSVFTELANYKDSAARIKEVKYAKAEELVKYHKYEEAIVVYKELGQYKDCTVLYPKVVLSYASGLIDTMQLPEAEAQLSIIAGYGAFTADVEAQYVRLAEAYYERNKYSEAISAYENTTEYREDPNKYHEMIYNDAQAFFDQKSYSAAKTAFSQIVGYSDADTKLLECDYQQGLWELSGCNYGKAIEAFERVADYKDSKEQINEAKYQYVIANEKSRMDDTTCAYLKDLKAANYKDGAAIYEELYGWKVEVVVVNSSTEDDQTNKTSISVVDPVIFHFKVSGGEPGVKTTLKVKSCLPNGEENWHTFSWEIYNGAEAWYGWEDGIYTISKNGKRGTLKLEFYDGDGNKIGESSVNIT